MSAPFSFSVPSSSRRLAAGGVIALHVGAIYALTQWTLGEEGRSVQLPPLQVAIVAEQPAPDHEILPPPPPITRQPVVVEMPLINLPDMPEQQRAITAERGEAPTRSSAGTLKLISAVEYIRQPLPQYPLTSRRLREEGLVMLKVFIDERGQAVQVQLHRSSGHERLDHAACEAVRRAKFKPYLENGVAHPAVALVPIEFTLNQRVAQR